MDQSTLQDYLDTLDVSEHCSDAALTQAYRDLVKVWHPDRFAHDDRLRLKAQEQLKDINHAYESLRQYRRETSSSQARSTDESRAPSDASQSSASEQQGDVVYCGTCGQALRVPLVSGATYIRCPACGHEQDRSGTPRPRRERRASAAAEEPKVSSTTSDDNDGVTPDWRRAANVLVWAGLGFLVAGLVRGLVAPEGPEPATYRNVAEAQPLTPTPDARIQALEAAAEKDPKDRQSRVWLGDLFFDAEQYPQAITWYEQAITLNPGDPNVSTDLGVAYYYTNQPDRALAQFDKSLATDPKHIKTLLNLGIVRAFGKKDLTGAARVWEQVVAMAPDSPEGQAAKKGLEGVKNAR